MQDSVSLCSHIITACFFQIFLCSIDIILY